MGVRDQAFRSGAFLAGRHVLGVAVRLVGVVLLTRTIGPSAYGLYAGPLAIVTVLATLSTAGIEMYLIRREEEPDKEIDDQAFTFLLVSSAAGTVLAAVAAVALRGSLLDERFTAPLLALACSIPLNVLWVPAQARLERAFRYREVAGIELAGEVVLYVVALVLAAGGAGLWAPVAGYLAMQAWLLVSSYWVARYRPCWRWSRPLLGEMVRYGFGYSSAAWVFRLHDLINPLVVGRYLGPAAVGQVALALRLVDTLAFAKRATGRLAVVVLAKVQSDPARLGRAHAEGMALQLLGAGAPLAVFALVATTLVPVLLGDGWQPAIEVFPLLALVTLVGTLFNLHSSALHVRRLNAPVVRLRVAQVALAAGAAVVLVPRYGVVGYGLAEALRLVAFVLVHRAVRVLFRPRYGAAVPWLVAWLPPLAAPWVPWPWTGLLVVPAVVVLLSRPARRQLGEILAGLKKGGGSVAPSR